MMTDPIADLLTRIRNGVRVERPYVDVPLSKIKIHIVEALSREGFVWDHECRCWGNEARAARDWDLSAVDLEGRIE